MVCGMDVQKALVLFVKSLFMEYIVYGTWNFKHAIEFRLFLVCMLDAGK